MQILALAELSSAGGSQKRDTFSRKQESGLGFVTIKAGALALPMYWLWWIIYDGKVQFNSMQCCAVLLSCCTVLSRKSPKLHPANLCSTKH